MMEMNILRVFGCVFCERACDWTIKLGTSELVVEILLQCPIICYSSCFSNVEGYTMLSSQLCATT